MSLDHSNYQTCSRLPIMIFCPINLSNRATLKKKQRVLYYIFFWYAPFIRKSRKIVLEFSDPKCWVFFRTYFKYEEHCLSGWMFILHLIALWQFDEGQIAAAPHRVQLRPRTLLESSMFTLLRMKKKRAREQTGN